MIEVNVNLNSYIVKSNLTIISLCNNINIDIPRFCYHELLSIAGNCRMCLVEVEKSLKPVASCAMPINNGMKIFTESLIVKKAREGVMELLLINHPLDCPICDQGGECDLQDQAIVFGSDRGRFYEYKRSVEDKNCGPLIKTVMTRCIHCTRCVRFFTEIGGIKTFGVTGRGNSMEIGTYIDNVMLSSEISGNVIDLCPVGALISKPYSFTARSWELKNVETIDVFDNLGSNIVLCLKGNNIMRILPLKNKVINEYWITDKIRFNYDGLLVQRLLRPLIKINSQFINISWEKIFSKLLRIIYKGENKFKALIGSNNDLESVVVLKDFITKLGFENLYTQINYNNGNLDFSTKYKLNSTIIGFEKLDLCILIGVNIRYEFPLLATRLRKLQQQKNIFILVFGNCYDYNLNVNFVGNGSKNLVQFFEGRLNICSVFLNSLQPLLLFGMNAFNNLMCNDFYGMLSYLLKYTNVITKDWYGLNFNFLGNMLVGFFELGIGLKKLESLIEDKNKILYLLNVDNFEYLKKENFIIYQGHHGDILMNFVDIILPGVSFFEKEGIYVNIEGRPQKGHFALMSSGNTRIDWKIINGLRDYMFYKVINHYKNIIDVRKKLIEYYPCVINLVNYGLLNINLNGYLILNNSVYNNIIYNYYITDNISRVSKSMGLCSKKKINNNLNDSLYLGIINNLIIKNKIWYT